MGEPSAPARLAFRLAAVVFLSLAALAGLSLGAAALAETEPNNLPADANDAPTNVSYVLKGDTTYGYDGSDFFRFNLTSTEVIEAVITDTLPCEGSDCNMLEAYSGNGAELLDPFNKPMEGGDVYFSGFRGDSFLLQVRGENRGGPYSVQVLVYPVEYESGERVALTRANETSAVVAIAGAQVKSSSHPYDLQLEGDGIYYGKALTLYVVNISPVNLVVVLPAGLTWIASDSIYTDFVVTHTQSFTVHAWTYIAQPIVVAAVSPYGWVPGDPSRSLDGPTYYLGPIAEGDLAMVTAETDRNSYSFEAEQMAVWAVTAGQSKADFDSLGGSTYHYNEARTLLSRAGVRTAITPTTRSSWLGNTLAYWPFCFVLIFLGLPVLFGISQAMRAVRLSSRQIDGAYSVNRANARTARKERQFYIREARQREKERGRQRKEERRAEREHRAVQVQPVPESRAPVPHAVGPATPFQKFMKADAEENFDLDSLNGLDFNAILAEAVAGHDSAAQASKKGEELRARLHQDVNDPDTIDDILRNRLLVWYRTSAGQAEWTALTTAAWGGLVAESTTAGGRKRAPLEKRFAALQDACDAKGKWIKPRPRVGQNPAARTAVTPSSAVDPAALKAEVTQAVLDDLSANPKSGDAPLPLPVLSEVAARYTPQRVNNALAEMFKADPRGPFVVLHPSRYPDCDITAIRPPAQGAKAGAMSYDLFFAKAATGVPTATAAGFVATSGVAGLIDTSSAVWTKENITKEEWMAVLGELQRQRQRLDPPPTNYRKLPAYFTLRKLLVESEEARRAFIATKWRGKPVGVPLLCQLLIDRSFMPEYDTDREYFEAELGDLERGDPQYLSATGTWTIAPGVVVKRSGGQTGTFTYNL